MIRVPQGFVWASVQGLLAAMGKSGDRLGTGGDLRGETVACLQGFDGLFDPVLGGFSLGSVVIKVGGTGVMAVVLGVPRWAGATGPVVAHRPDGDFAAALLEVLSVVAVFLEAGGVEGGVLNMLGDLLLTVHA